MLGLNSRSDCETTQGAPAGQSWVSYGSRNSCSICQNPINPSSLPLQRFCKTLSLSSWVSRILFCSRISFSSYWCFRVWRRLWLFSNSSMSFCFISISQVRSARSAWKFAARKRREKMSTFWRKWDLDLYNHYRLKKTQYHIEDRMEVYPADTILFQKGSWESPQD